MRKGYVNYVISTRDVDSIDKKPKYNQKYFESMKTDSERTKEIINKANGGEE